MFGVWWVEVLGVWSVVAPLVVMGQKGLAARWVLQFCTHVWVCAVIQNRHEIGHQSSACAEQFQRAKKLTAHSLRFANNVRLTERFNHGPNSRGSARGWRKVDSISTSTHVLLPAMSSIALETRAVHSR